MKRIALFTGVLLAAALCCRSNAAAQSLTITSPTHEVTVKEGDDYATQILDNPWDFAERRDIGWEENFAATTINVSGGVWSGQNASPGGYVFPLFPGFAGSLFPEPLPGDRNLPKLGISHRIDTSKYTLLAYRLRHSQRGSFAVYWDADDSRSQYWPDPNSPRGASYDGFYHWNAAYPIQGWNIYSFDMTRLTSSFEQRQGSWSGLVYALRLDPSTTGGTGALTEFDWVRLVDPSSAPELTISWNSSGISQFSVITIYADDNASGFDGTPIARFTNGSNPGSYTLKTAMLPPGSWHFYVTAQTGSGGSMTGTVYRSNYSARLTINAQPRGWFTAPTPLTGDDYAASEVGNAWNMDSSADVPNLNSALWPPEWRQFSTPSFNAMSEAEDGYCFQAQADPPRYDLGNTESDVQVHLNISATRPLDPHKYRYLSYRLAVDPSNYPTIADKVSRGWVSRPVFWNTDVINDAGRAKAHVVYEGWNTYTIDLWDSSIIEQGSPWLSFSRIDHLRIDPLETDVYTWFFLDWVKLSAENRSTSGRYNLAFYVEDADNSSFTVDLYYDNDNQGYNGSHLATLTGVSSGAHSYSWDTNGLAEGAAYYVYAAISDGRNTSRVYAPVPVKIGAYVAEPVPRSMRAAYDFDGDGKSDRVVYRQSTGTYFEDRSRDGFWSLPWGGRTFRPLQGDFDGDGKTDIGLIITYANYYFWYITRSSDGALYAPIWGLNGDDIVIGDYNGNGRDEVAVYRDGAWFILDENGVGYPLYWGIPGDIPVPRDYDGDGTDDLAVWRPADGMWWILYSGFTGGYAPDYYAAIQWGLPGDIPVPGDWSGDGKVDPAVFRPALGTWYTRDIVTSETTVTQWGLPGDVPMVGDYNGDGIQDFTVYREPYGMWYHNYRNGQVEARQFGLPRDLLPDKAN